MGNLFYIDIVSPNKIIYKGEIISLVVPAELGYLGILANHAPLVATITKGKITIRDGSNNIKALDYPGQGFMEVLGNHVTLILGCDINL